MIQLLEKKTGTRIIVFTLLLTILAWLVPPNIRTVHAGETSAFIEKSHSQNHSQGKGTTNIPTAKKALPAKSLSKPAEGKLTGKAKAASNSFDIHIAGEYQQAKAYEMLRYANQNRDYEHKLQWDSELEEAAMIRAAELPIYYSTDTRPNGQEYNTSFTAWGYTSASETYRELYELDLEYSFDEQMFDNHAYTHFAAAAFKADNDIIYWVVLFNNEPWGNANPVNQNYEDNNVLVNVTDQYLDWEACFLNSSKNECSEKNLIKGKTYNAWIYVYNYNSDRYYDDDPILIQTQEASSSNTSVLTIDRWGTIQTKKAGSATVKVSPSEDSGYETTYHCVVRPGKVSGLKLAPKNKAVALKWGKVTGASGYQIYRSTSKSGSYKPIKTVGNSTTNYTNTGLNAGKKYYYKVRGYVSHNGTKYVGAFSNIAGAKTKGTAASVSKYVGHYIKYYSREKNNELFISVDIKKVANGKVTFRVVKAGRGGSILYDTPYITAKLKNKKASFKWEDSHLNRGKGTLALGSNKVKLKMKETKHGASSYSLDTGGEITLKKK